MKRKTFVGYTIVAAMIFLLTACGGNKVVVSNSPEAQFYRSSAVDFKSFESALIVLEEISTNNNQGVDEVKAAASQSLETWLRQSGLFKKVTSTEADATGKTLVVKAKVSVNWGSRAARAIVGMGAGSARIFIKYNAYEKGSSQLIAKMDAQDAMTGMGGQAWGGSSKELVYAGTEKWNKVFVNNILKGM
ncbi:MAG: DUF4410 domain-containing protein [Deltaproteobacteria bacterium]|nr:DUF4410 domain-containing protein [Deltaproteobacteria bacterium]